MEPCTDGSGKSQMMKNGQLFRVVEKNCYSLEERLKDMDATGRFAFLVGYNIFCDLENILKVLYKCTFLSDFHIFLFYFQCNCRPPTHSITILSGTVMFWYCHVKIGDN